MWLLNTVGAEVRGMGRHLQVTNEDRTEIYGENRQPEKAGKALWEFLWDACKDFTLVILLFCGIVTMGRADNKDEIHSTILLSADVRLD